MDLGTVKGQTDAGDTDHTFWLAGGWQSPSGPTPRALDTDQTGHRLPCSTDLGHERNKLGAYSDRKPARDKKYVPTTSLSF